jgi:hypothetical protein
MSGKVIDKIVNEGEGIVIRYHPFIQVSVVLYRVKLSVFLSDEEEATGVGRIESSNSFQSEVLGKKLLLLFLFLGG